MAIVLIPNFGGQLVQNLARHVPAVGFQLVDPNYQLVSLSLRECQDPIFQFSYVCAHHNNNATERFLFQACMNPRKPMFSSLAHTSGAQFTVISSLNWLTSTSPTT